MCTNYYGTDITILIVLELVTTKIFQNYTSLKREFYSDGPVSAYIFASKVTVMMTITVTVAMVVTVAVWSG